MNHKTGTVLRLTLREAAERWATECRSIGPETLAALLAECALKGGFEFALAKDEPAPWNFDPELGKVVEVFDRDGRPKTAYELSFGHFAHSGCGDLFRYSSDAGTFSVLLCEAPKNLRKPPQGAASRGRTQHDLWQATRGYATL